MMPIARSIKNKLLSFQPRKTGLLPQNDQTKEERRKNEGREEEDEDEDRVCISLPSSTSSEAVSANRQTLLGFLTSRFVLADSKNWPRIS